MTIRIARGTQSRAKSTMVVVLQLSSTEPPERIATVLEEARAAIRAAYGPDSDLWVSEPLTVKGGLALLIGRGWWSPPGPLGREPAILKEVAERHGLRDGVISIAPPTKDAWQEARHVGAPMWPTARGYLYGVLQQPFGPAPREVPRDLIRDSLDWLRARARPSGAVNFVVNGAAIPADWENVYERAVSLIEGTLILVVVADDPTDPRYSHHPPPTIVITGSPDPTAAWIEAAETDDKLTSAMHAMRDYARDAAAVEWAGVAANVDGSFGPSYYEDDVVHLPGDSGGYIATSIRDIAIPDAFWWQRIGPGHLERLGSIPAQAVPLGELAGHYEVTFGQPQDWFAGSPSSDVTQGHAREALAPLLLDKTEADRLSTERFMQARRTDETGYFKHLPPAP